MKLAVVFHLYLFFIEGREYAIPTITKPINPKGGGIKSATINPIVINIMPSFVHKGQPIVEQEDFCGIEDFSFINETN